MENNELFRRELRKIVDHVAECEAYIHSIKGHILQVSKEPRHLDSIIHCSCGERFIISDRALPFANNSSLFDMLNSNDFAYMVNDERRKIEEGKKREIREKSFDDPISDLEL